MEQNFVFQCTPLEPDALIPQVSQALEVRTEFVSRAVCPKLWAVTDRLNRTKKLPQRFGTDAAERGRSWGWSTGAWRCYCFPQRFSLQTRSYYPLQVGYALVSVS